jgi:Holliday junction resolvasome RuvABC endonuclease subunit
MIIAIDPGLNFCGISILDFNEKFCIHRTILINNNRKLTQEEKEISEKYDTRVIKVQEIVRTIISLIEQYNPDSIAIEGPFYSGLRPQAYSALLEIITAVKYLVAVPNGLPIHIIEPLLVKKTFSHFHMSTKDDMKAALKKKMQNDEIFVAQGIDIEQLSEHEIDSIAVGFSFLTLIQSRS